MQNEKLFFSQICQMVSLSLHSPLALTRNKKEEYLKKLRFIEVGLMEEESWYKIKKKEKKSGSLITILIKNSGLSDKTWTKLKRRLGVE